MKQIVIFPRGGLNAADRKALSKEGYVAIEADDPTKVIMPLPAGAVTGDMLTLCALNAMAGTNSSDERAKFTAELTARLNARAATSASG